ncbi:CBS domain-containing protein [Actinospica robiniae]|uniref:CBS domain-containing protein n=1 Tax=Actinospica robiniae TaxID=304901 RepID=UPI0004094EFD|nr:CBS domain-containing protein [Actinospica robiniae]
MAQTVSEIMSTDPATVPGQVPISEVARLMREREIGDVLVTDEGRLYGVLTDRDIVVRAVAEERSDTATAMEICSGDVVSCRVADEVDRALALMREHAVRRLPVVEDGRPVGVVSLGDLAIERDQRSALADISAAHPSP